MTKISNMDSTSVPICADVTKFDFKKLAQQQLKHAGRLFDGNIIN
jgi:hypothetical protein